MKQQQEIHITKWDDMESWATEEEIQFHKKFGEKVVKQDPTQK